MTQAACQYEEKYEEWPPTTRPRYEEWDIFGSRRAYRPVADLFWYAKKLGIRVQNTQKKTRASAITLPHPSYTRRADESLTKTERLLLDKYLCILEQACASIATPISKITVDSPPDPEEGIRNIVVTCHFDVDVDTAFLHWEDIGKQLEAWACGPDEDTAAEVLELISMNISWRE